MMIPNKIKYENINTSIMLNTSENNQKQQQQSIPTKTTTTASKTSMKKFDLLTFQIFCRGKKFVPQNRENSPQNKARFKYSWKKTL